MPTDPSWLVIARAELAKHIIEEPGPLRNNPRILEYHASTTLHAQTDEIAWCSAFVNWCMEQAKIHGTGLALARSWLKWGMLLAEPKLGCVTILKRGSNPSQGHVGFWIGEDGSHLILLGGNQGDMVCLKPFPKADVLGYRWPRLSDYRTEAK